MSNGIINSRIQNKHDTQVNWDKATNFIPKTGEIIIYDPDENYNYSRFKIGDGIRTVNNLEFLLSFSSDYNDLINTPVLPKYVSDLEDDLGIATTNYVDLVKKQIPTLISQLENDLKFISEDYVKQNLQDLKSEVILTTPQVLTEEQKNQVKENLGIDSTSSESTSITTEYTYTYDGDMNGKEWVLNESDKKVYVRLGDIPEGTINVIGSQVSAINAVNSTFNKTFEVTEEHLTRSLSMYEGSMIAEAQQDGFIQILELIGHYYTDPVSALCICTKPGSYIISFGGWLEWITFDKTGIYGYETRTLGGNEYCTSYTFTATLNETDSNESSSPIEYEGNEIQIFSRGICIGDSVTEGSFDDDSNGIIVKRFSYPAILKRLTNIDIVNAGIAGATTASWYEASLNSDAQWGKWVNDEWVWNTNPSVGATDIVSSELNYSNFDFAIIHLGINDFGLAATVTTENIISNFATNINTIITKLKNSSPGIKIFLATIIPTYAPSYNTDYKLMNEKIAEIAENTENVFLMDLNKYSELASQAEYSVTHPTALGYHKMANEIKSYISYIIGNNLNKFTDIQFIGNQGDE